MRVVHRYQYFDTPELTTNHQQRSVKNLYIEADEGHIHKDAKGIQFGHLIVVHEGWRQVDRSHRQLVNKHTFGGVYGQKTETFWFSVLDYLSQNYDLATVQRIIVSGDGASWIKQGTAIIPKSQFVLDKFHTFKALTTIANELNVPKATLYRWVMEDKRHLFKDLLHERRDENGDSMDETMLERFTKSTRYIKRNWRAIQNQALVGFHGTNMEGQVSYVIADRMTSRPMCWSTVGANNMIHWRILKINGVNILAEIRRQRQAQHNTQKITELDERVLRQVPEFVSHIGVFSASFINHSALFNQINYNF